MTHDFAAISVRPEDLEFEPRRFSRSEPITPAMLHTLMNGMALNHHRASCGRNIRRAMVAAGVGLLFAAGDATMGGAFLAIAIAALFTFLAIRDQRRADSIFARGVAAALLEGAELGELAEAA